MGGQATCQAHAGSEDPHQHKHKPCLKVRLKHHLCSECRPTHKDLTMSDIMLNPQRAEKLMLKCIELVKRVIIQFELKRHLLYPGNTSQQNWRFYGTQSSNFSPTDIEYEQKLRKSSKLLLGPKLTFYAEYRIV